MIHLTALSKAHYTITVNKADSFMIGIICYLRFKKLLTFTFLYLVREYTLVSISLQILIIIFFPTFSCCFSYISVPFKELIKYVAVDATVYL